MPPLVLPDPYAEVSDLQSYWRVLSTAEQGRAATLLGWAAKRIQEEPGAEEFDPLVCAQVSMDMVKRAMINGDGVIDTTTAQSMSDMNSSVTNRYVNPTGNLYLTNQEADRLAGRPDSGGGFSLTLSSNVRVPGEPWNRQPSGQTDGLA